MSKIVFNINPEDQNKINRLTVIALITYAEAEEIGRVNIQNFFLLKAITLITLM
jgi:hypothetical protein